MMYDQVYIICAGVRTCTLPSVHTASSHVHFIEEVVCTLHNDVIIAYSDEDMLVNAHFCIP